MADKKRDTGMSIRRASRGYQVIDDRVGDYVLRTLDTYAEATAWLEAAAA